MIKNSLKLILLAVLTLPTFSWAESYARFPEDLGAQRFDMDVYVYNTGGSEQFSGGSVEDVQRQYNDRVNEVCRQYPGFNTWVRVDYTRHYVAHHVYSWSALYWTYENLGRDYYHISCN